MNDARKEDTHRSPTASLDDILKGEILTRITREITAKNIEEITVRARRRFDKNALWIIGITEIDFIGPGILEQFRTSFVEFRKAGGALIIIITNSPNVMKAFRGVAMEAGNIPLKIARNTKESNELASTHRAKFKKY